MTIDCDGINEAQSKQTGGWGFHCLWSDDDDDDDVLVELMK